MHGHRWAGKTANADGNKAKADGNKAEADGSKHEADGNKENADGHQQARDGTNARARAKARQETVREKVKARARAKDPAKAKVNKDTADEAVVEKGVDDKSEGAARAEWCVFRFPRSFPGTEACFVYLVFFRAGVAQLHPLHGPRARVFWPLFVFMSMGVTGQNL